MLIISLIKIIFFSLFFYSLVPIILFTISPKLSLSPLSLTSLVLTAHPSFLAYKPNPQSHWSPKLDKPSPPSHRQPKPHHRPISLPITLSPSHLAHNATPYHAQTLFPTNSTSTAFIQLKSTMRLIKVKARQRNLAIVVWLEFVGLAGFHGGGLARF